MSKINWEWFFGNSSTEEAIGYFAKGRLTFKQFAKNVNYHSECRKIIPILKVKGYKKSKGLAQRALKRRGFDTSDWDFDVCVC